MNRKALVTSLGLLSFVTPTLCIAAEHATQEQAVAMVQKAIERIKTDGAEKAYAAFDDKTNSDFHDRDLYVVVYGLDGKVLAHGANPKLIGKQMIDAQDVDGVYFVRERVQLARAKSEFWQDYKFTDPMTKKIEPKRMYCRRFEETAVCGGIHR